MFGLVDCNNFFVSCERVFNPLLNGKPVVVLSNNDGCVIARSNEAKALGIPMGCPAFQIKNYTPPRNVVQLSARHIVYADLSHRVMSIMGNEVENLQIYSVDEAFFDLPYESVEENHRFLAGLVRKIYQYVGIPVSFGFAPTRTLAKIASHIAKNDARITDGVYWLVRPEAINIILKRTPIGHVWGVGRHLAASLSQRGIDNAYKFSQVPPSLIKTLYSVSAERTCRELRGESCQVAHPITIAHKSLMTSRTFASIITKRSEVKDAVLHFAKQTAKRLRDEQLVASTLTVFLRSDRYREDLPYYSNSCQVHMGTPSASAMVLIHYAMIAFNNIFREGYTYRRAGVVVTDIAPDAAVQLDAFDEMNHERQKHLMQAIDGINRQYGAEMVKLAPESQSASWTPKQTHYADDAMQSLRFYSGINF